MVLLQQSSITKLAPGSVGCFWSRHSLADEPFCEQVDVSLYFIAELAVGFSQAEEPAKSRKGATNPVAHDYFCASRRRTRPMTLEIRSQFSVSIVSRFSPCFVIE